MCEERSCLSEEWGAAAAAPSTPATLTLLDACTLTFLDACTLMFLDACTLTLLDACAVT